MVENPIKLPDLGPMHEAMGDGISSFAVLEFAIGMCFASMLEPAPRRNSVAVFNAARSFEAKMKMIDALAGAALEASDLKRWRSLSSKIGRRKAVRDKLAHWMAGVYPAARSGDDISKMKPALLPPLWSKQHMEVLWGDDEPVKPLFLHQLEEFKVKCGDLTGALFEFADSIKPQSGNEDAR